MQAPTSAPPLTDDRLFFTEDLAKVNTIDEPVYMTRFEMARIISLRAEELEMGSKPRVPLSSCESTREYDIAARELASGALLGMTIRRFYPDGTFRNVPLAMVRLPPP